MSVHYQEIGRRIAARRRALHLKQTQVCEMCDLNDKYLSAIECARSIPSIEVLLRICKALDITPNDLLLGVTSQEKRDVEHELLQVIHALSDEQASHVLSFAKWLLTAKEL